MEAGRPPRRASILGRLGTLPVLLGLVAWLAAGAGRASAASPTLDEAPHRLQRAVATQAAARDRLRFLGDATSCTEARYVSYRRSDAEPSLADQWYVAAQLWADALLLLAAREPVRTPAVAQLPATPARARPPPDWDEADARCHLDKGFIFLDRLWDDEVGGYYRLSNISGTSLNRDARLTDDNSLAGLALLATLESAPDEASRQRYLHAARREAEFLMGSNLWDETFGGGFWWSTEKSDAPESKPAQSNALAALFFARLHERTGDPVHRAWSLRTLLWLDTILYEPSRQLYRWSVYHRDGTPTVSARFFNYDQGIAVEAQLAALGLDGDPNRLARARAVGRAAHAAFWGRERGGYNLEVGVEQVYTSYAAWLSLGHLALFEADGDAGWLELARSNAGALDATLGEPDGGYAYRHYRCVDRRAPGCDSGEAAWVVDRTRDTSAHALMQHLHTALGRAGLQSCELHTSKAMQGCDRLP